MWLFFGAYAVLIGGTQILQWIYPNELFPTAVRGSAVAITLVGAVVGVLWAPETRDLNLSDCAALAPSATRSGRFRPTSVEPDPTLSFP